MTKVLKLLVAVLNTMHDLILYATEALGLRLTDKQLHFWLLGSVGMLVFVVFDVIFKKLAKWSISAITFVYTFTVLVVLVLAIEIEQKVTQTGNMEFEDIIAGLGGFLAIFLVYLLIKTLIIEFRK